MRECGSFIRARAEGLEPALEILKQTRGADIPKRDTDSRHYRGRA